VTSVAQHALRFPGETRRHRCRAQNGTFPRAYRRGVIRLRLALSPAVVSYQNMARANAACGYKNSGYRLPTNTVLAPRSGGILNDHLLFAAATRNARRICRFEAASVGRLSSCSVLNRRVFARASRRASTRSLLCRHMATPLHAFSPMLPYNIFFGDTSRTYSGCVLRWTISGWATFRGIATSAKKHHIRFVFIADGCLAFLARASPFAAITLAP